MNRLQVRIARAMDAPRNDRDIPPHHRPETADVIADEASEHLRSQP